MGGWVKHTCGYCGVNDSPVLVHGKEIQQAWYKDAKFGYLCRNCYNRQNRTGTIMFKRDWRKIEESRMLRNANLRLKPHGWKCIAIVTNLCKADGILYSVKYTMKCEHCGRVIVWTKDIDFFLKDKASICDCKVMQWSFDNNAFPKRGNGSYQRIAKEFLDNPELSSSDIARKLGLSRQRIEQVRTTLRTAYVVEMRRMYGEISKAVMNDGEN